MPAIEVINNEQLRLATDALGYSGPDNPGQRRIFLRSELARFVREKIGEQMQREGIEGELVRVKNVVESLDIT